MRSQGLPCDAGHGLVATGVAATLRWIVCVAVVIGLVFALAPAARAHTDFESSDPADGSVAASPVSQIRVRFTAASLIAGDGFVVRTPGGEIVMPEVSISSDQREFTLLFSPPLVNGDVGVQWSVRAGDAHPIEGTFSFTTTAPALTPVPTVSAPEPPLKSEPEPSGGGATVVQGGGESESELELDAGFDADPLDVVEPGSERIAGEDPQPVPAVTTDEDADGAGSIRAGEVSLDDFLQGDGRNGLAGPVGYLGRLASQAGSLIAIGVVAFAMLVSKLTERDAGLFVQLIRRAGYVAIAGSVIEAIGLVLSLGSFKEGLFGSAGVAVLLRLVGAVGLVLSSAISRAGVDAAGGVGSVPRELVAVGSTTADAGVGPDSGRLASGTQVGSRKSVVTFSPVGWGLVGIVVVSFLLDGHTVTKGNRVVTATLDLVHVGGGAIWLGGLICLFVISPGRGVESDRAGFIESVVRFSVVAAVALAAVGVAGLALTVTILDSVSELWLTTWGRLLIAKVATVTVAAAAGAFNHFVLVPQLQSISDGRDVEYAFVRTLKIELAALGSALVVTAALVAAAS